MERESREIVSNYQIAMWQEINALDDWALGLDYFLDHLHQLESLARNCREKIVMIETQLKLDV